MKPTLCLDTHDLAWAAGFFDGEGTVLARQRTEKRKELSLSVSQSELTSLHRFHRAVGGIGKVRGPYQTKHKPTYVFHAYGLPDVQAIIAMIWRWLGEPKRADAVRAFSRSIASEREKQERKDNPRCKRGHPLAGVGADVRINKNRKGHEVRTCRYCVRIRTGCAL